MRWIYISPHLDDAVLSCGGLIFEQSLVKQKVEIWTIFAGDPPDGELSPFAQKLHSEWGSGADTPDRRRLEDAAACRHLGARYRHLPFQDCIYRQARASSWIYASEEALWGEVSREDEPTIQTLQTFLAASLKPDDILVGPLTIGKHIDHQMVRQALEGLERPLMYYADIPYLFNHLEQFSELTRDLQSQLYPISTQALAAWQEAIGMYASQIESLFNDIENMNEMIQYYYQKEFGIHFWKPGLTA
jgi:LmbE family N-acetylglucosaminyl deacetylase